MPSPLVGTAEAPVAADSSSDLAAGSASQDSLAWRQQVAEKLNRYQARRKPRPPRYPSLRLQFEQTECDHASHGILAETNAYQPVSSGGASPALALDSFAEPAAPPPAPAPPPALPATAKILEFPRSWAAPPAPLEELAEPVMAQPRILEVPALPPAPPALGGITIEAALKPALEKRPGIDIPLHSAPLLRRLLAAGVDTLVVAAACALFASVFWRVAAVRPPRLQILAFMAALASFLWAAIQYLSLIYSRTTLGLQLARLDLCRFDGTSPSRRLRRWRVLASFLSAASLGMGYLWIFLDEDALCWHDRITHTYLAPKRHQTAK
jgi:hypothetical protein